MRTHLSILRHGGLQRRAKALAALCVAGLLLPLASAFENHLPGALAWGLDLAVHWQWFFLAGLVLALPMLAFAHRRWVMAAALVPLPWLTATPAAVRGGEGVDGLVVAAANVHLDNESPERLARWVGETKPEVLAILEISDTFAQRLGLDDAYPHRVVRPRWDPFGIALLSRHPIVRHAVVEEGGATPRIEAVVDWNGTEVTVVAFHPMPPISAADHLLRNQLLADITARYADRPTIVMGDFNATPWSSAFGAPRRHGFMLAGGLQATWPAPLRGVIGLPIDHVMVSRHWSVIDHVVGPDLGSDHLPTLATVSPHRK
ncbi:hypothetical protein AzCIB_1366 [Azoarcus sp. CIB]|uniref:endonuclease/exonuclease/phosphatase family protein n=1 Tax=Aromatoleum sp. (strain CIB) TaxID=198107 RepID=UPI0006A2C7AB|nr:endonuclease/exonuclease/phosphatase family protein [Azoarcus sp. CIB]AKU11271.1 hypothetical protein AzCIB_1366 [Azoarcus sp. CIB]